MHIFIHNIGCTLEKFGSITARCKGLFSPQKLPASYSKDSEVTSPWCEAETSPASGSNLKDVWNRPLHISDSFSVHRQESSTVHTTIHTGYVDCLLASSQHNLYDIYLLLCVQY